MIYRVCNAEKSLNTIICWLFVIKNVPFLFSICHINNMYCLTWVCYGNAFVSNAEQRIRESGEGEDGELNPCDVWFCQAGNGRQRLGQTEDTAWRGAVQNCCILRHLTACVCVCVWGRVCCLFRSLTFTTARPESVTRRRRRNERERWGENC